MSGARHDHTGSYQHHLSGDFQFHDELVSLFAQRPDAQETPMMQQPWFTDYMQATTAPTPLDYDAFAAGYFDLPAVDEVVKWELVVDDDTTGGAAAGSRPGGATTAPLTPNSMSMSSTSSEACGAGAGAGVGEESAAEKCKEEEGEESKDGSAAAKEDVEGEEKNKKGAAKGKGKGEKRPRQPRFAFITKSEVDNLEDGYRWPGAKLAQNRPWSYYRCTTQKCPVKKRVERSYQDAAVVITTYEGKHTHPIPATLRGSSHLLATAHHHAGLHHPHFRMPPPPPDVGALAFMPGGGGANAFDALGFLQPPPQQGHQGHHHAMPQQLVTGAGAAAVSTGFLQVNAAIASQHALPGHQHGLAAAIAGTAGTTAAATTATAAAASAPLRTQHFMAQDYAGLWQDIMFPSFVHNNDDGDTHHHH